MFSAEEARRHYYANAPTIFLKVACKRRSSVNSGAWLRRFDDVTGVEKRCVAKGIKRNKANEKFFIIANIYTLPQTSNTWMYAMFKNFFHSQPLKPIFLCPNRCETQISKNYQTSE